MGADFLTVGEEELSLPSCWGAGADAPKHKLQLNRLVFAFALLFCLGAVSRAIAQTSPAPAKSTTPAKSTRPAAAKPATAGGLPAPVKSYGSKTAPITMEVFTDYQCPSCRNFFEGTLKAMIDDYVASGKVYLIHHDFPLAMHMYSGIAARWANAAARIGQFPAVEAALYDNQNLWETNGDIQKYVAAAMPAADLKKIETQLAGCESPAITSKQDNSNPLAGITHPCSLDNYIAADIALGYAVPVRATPTFIITCKGQKYPATATAVSWPILKQFFDSLLSQ